MKEMDLFDFLDPAWSASKIDVQPIEHHPSMKSLQLIAYQEVLDWSGSGELQSYFLIVEGAGKNPYHLGSASPVIIDPVVNPDTIEQKFMLSHPNRWRLTPWLKEKDVQWTPWIWKNSEAEQRFMDWHSKWFVTWTQEAWDAARKRKASWRPAKENNYEQHMG